MEQSYGQNAVCRPLSVFHHYRAKNMDKKEVVIPIIREEVRADAVPVMTGGVRVTKRMESRGEIVEQELRKSRVEVKRVKVDRVVDGPQSAQRVGKTLIIPVVSEVLRIEKQWVVTEEIHITEREEHETVQNQVNVNYETAHIERFDSASNITTVDESERALERILEPRGIVQRTHGQSGAKKAGRPRSLLKRPPADG